VRIASAILEAELSPAAILTADGNVQACNAAFRSNVGFEFLSDQFRRSLRISLGTNGPVPCGVKKHDGVVVRGKLFGLEGYGKDRIFLLRVLLAGTEQKFQHLTERLNQRNADLSRKSRDESMFGHILNATVEGILVADSTGRVIESNVALARMLGPIDHLDQVFPQREWQRHFLLQDAKADSKPIPIKFRDPSDEDLFAEITMGKAKTIDETLFVFVFHDVTDRIKLETATAAADEADRQMKIAQLRDEAKSRFLSVISHELRTPLHGIISALDLIEQHGIQDPDLRDLFQIAAKSSEAALTQVNRILEITRLEARIGSDLVSDSFNPANLVRNVIKQQQAFATKNSNAVSMVFSGLKEIHVTGDAYLFLQIVQNLVSNALKFTKKGSVDVVLHITAAPHNRCDIDFSVSDSGVGFEVSQTDRLLREFETGNDRYSRIEDGAGIGLALVSRAVARMSGTLLIDSTPGKGSSFRVKLNLERGEGSPQDVVAAVAASDQSSYKLDVLVADDTEINRDVLQRLLERFGCRTWTAENGQTALNLLADRVFNIVFMDVSMPEVDGIEATRRFRLTEQHSRTTIIGVTAHSDPETRMLCLEAGMDEVVVKPFRTAALEALLKRSREKDASQTTKPH
jgi:signal transduction histidine kinase/ActR/RegA family two-component response regulator